MSEHPAITDELIAGDRIRAILARASDLDAKGLTGIRRNELERIAAEAGISSAAVQQALSEEFAPIEVLAEPEPGKSIWKMDIVKDIFQPIGRRVSTTLSFTAIGAVFGYWGTVNPRDGETLAFGVAVLIATAAYRAVRHRKDKDAAAYRSEVISMFVALFLTYYTFTPEVPDGALLPGLAVITAFVAMLGTLIVQFRNDDHVSAVDARATANR